MIVIIDNYDSFTYNVVQEVAKLTGEPIKVLRSRECTVADIDALKPSRLIVSPGPGTPLEAGVSIDAIKYFAGKIPILGVCLGHQAIGAAFGAKIVGAKFIRHGIVEEISLDGRGVFRSIGKKAKFTRYHSLVIDEATLSDELEVTARAADGDIMGVRHKKYDIEGVQFHPESIASNENGECAKLFASFLSYRRENLPVTQILNTLAEKKDLSEEMTELFMDDLTDGFQNQMHTAAILTALAVKGPAASEMAGCARVLCRKKKPLPLKDGTSLTDIVGTGGDGKGSFNISSMSALAAASCGLAVAKHGNRAVSSKSGAADFFENLGFNIMLSPEKTADVINKTNFGFLFAPVYHSAMRFAAPVRAALGIKTIMNLIGPLSNPAGAGYQMLGVYSDDLLVPYAQASKLLGSRRVMVVHSDDGFDEISPCTKTNVAEIDEAGQLRTYSIKPEDFGISGCTTDGLGGGTGKENADIARGLMANPTDAKYKTIFEAVCLNAGAALYVGGKATSIHEGYVMIREAFTSGKVREKVEAVRQATN